jgi:uncharacterized SAM-binding protein YcdF (DUF218 family)
MLRGLLPICFIGIFASYLYARALIKKLEREPDADQHAARIARIKKLDLSVRAILVVIGMITIALS